MWYNIEMVVSRPLDTGLNFKLDVGLYRLDQQVACQRYRQTTIDVKNLASRVASMFRMPQLVPAVNFA